MHDQELLALVELGGYPNFIPLYQSQGYRVEMVNSVRKAQAWLKKHNPEVVVAELYVDPNFRDRLSNLESLLATLQRYAPDARVLVFYDAHYRDRLDQVSRRYPIHAAFAFPIDESGLSSTLNELKQSR